MKVSTLLRQAAMSREAKKAEIKKWARELEALADRVQKRGRGESADAAVYKRLHKKLMTMSMDMSAAYDELQPDSE